MSKTEIIAELPRLTAGERAEVRAKLDELDAAGWQDHGELTDADRQALDTALADYEKAPDAGNSWEHVKARVRSRLRP